MTSPSDQLLAEQVRQGNEKAFVRLRLIIIEFPDIRILRNFVMAMRFLL